MNDTVKFLIGVFMTVWFREQKKLWRLSLIVGCSWAQREHEPRKTSLGRTGTLWSSSGEQCNKPNKGRTEDPEWKNNYFLRKETTLQGAPLSGSWGSPRNLQPPPPSLQSMAEPRKTYKSPDAGFGSPGAVPGHSASGDGELGAGMWSRDQSPGSGSGWRLPPESDRGGPRRGADLIVYKWGNNASVKYLGHFYISTHKYFWKWVLCFCVPTCGTSNIFLCSSPQLPIETPVQDLMPEHLKARSDLLNPCQNNSVGGISPKDLNRDMSPGKGGIPSATVMFLRAEGFYSLFFKISSWPCVLQ